MKSKKGQSSEVVSQKKMGFNLGLAQEQEEDLKILWSPMDKDNTVLSMLGTKKRKFEFSYDKLWKGTTTYEIFLHRMSMEVTNGANLHSGVTITRAYPQGYDEYFVEKLKESIDPKCPNG